MVGPRVPLPHTVIALPLGMLGSLPTTHVAFGERMTLTMLEWEVVATVATLVGTMLAVIGMNRAYLKGHQGGFARRGWPDASRRYRGVETVE